MGPDRRLRRPDGRRDAAPRRSPPAPSPARSTGGRQDDAARFYAAETAKVLQGFFHAAALTGRTLEHVLEWVANPVAAEQPAEILQQHPHAARFWDGLLPGALHGDGRHRRQHRHHRAAGDGAVLPARRSAPAASPRRAGRPPTSPT